MYKRHSKGWQYYIWFGLFQSNIPVPTMRSITKCNPLKPKREGTEIGEVVGETTFGRGDETIPPVLKVSRLRPLILVGVMYMIAINFYMTLEVGHYDEILTNIGRAACVACSAAWEFG
jgi:hypothetical protein